MAGRFSASGDPTPISLSPADQPDVALAARLDVPLLIEGDTSTGRYAMARAVHEQRPQTQGPWIALCCGATPLPGWCDGLLDHEAGADGDLAGWFKKAAGGTLFLDDISQLTGGRQAQLEGLLEANGQRGRETNQNPRGVRLIVGAAPRLRTEVAAGRFSERLFYRLNVIRVECPAPEAAAVRRLTVREVMSTTLHTCQPTTDLAAVAQIMWNYDCGFVPVLDLAGRVAGVVTDRDICIATATRRLLPEQLSAAQVMTPAVRTCAPDDAVESALESMRQAGVRRLPVIEAQGRIQGVLSMNDIVRAVGRKGAPEAATVAAALASISEPRSFAAAVA